MIFFKEEKENSNKKHQTDKTIQTEGEEGEGLEFLI